jgi:protein-S-isoprenylcysteine O-methyltransferase Ste14
MLSPKTQGYIYAVIQFSLGGIIILLSFIEHYSIERKYVPFIRYGSYVLVFICAVLMILAFSHFGQYITANPVPRHSAVLRTTGIYSIIRHPMYMGALIGLIGLSLAFNAYYTSLLNIIMICFFVIKINFEERHLVEKFPEYRAYQKKTKKLVPYIY